MRFDPQSNYVSRSAGGRAQPESDDLSSPGMKLWIILCILLTLGGVGFIVWTQIQPVAANAIHPEKTSAPRELAIIEWVEQLEKADPEYFKHTDPSTESADAAADENLSTEDRAESRRAYEKGRAFAGLGEHERALPHLQVAVQLNPQWPEAHYALGMAYSITGAREQAQAEVEVLRKLDPNLANLLSNLLQ